MDDAKKKKELISQCLAFIFQQVTKQISEFCYVFDTKYERNQKHRQVHCV
jgi:hypothetical protein